MSQARCGALEGRISGTPIPGRPVSSYLGECPKCESSSGADSESELGIFTWDAWAEIEEDPQTEEVRELQIDAKGLSLLDDCRSLGEAADRLEAAAAQLRELVAEGWVLVQAPSQPSTAMHISLRK